MTILGQLVQPRLLVQWGGKNLVLWEEEETAIESVSFDFQDSEVYPSCSIVFSGSPKGYAAYRECIDNFREDPITIAVGYPNGTWLTTQYFYTGASLGSGNSNLIEVSGSAKSKEFLSSFYTGQYIEGSLVDLSIKVQEAAGVPEEGKEDVKFTEAGKRLAENKKLEGNVTGTVGQVIEQQLNEAGVGLDHTGTAQPGGSATGYAPPAMAAEMNTDQPKEPPKSGDVLLKDETYGFIIGPGLIEEFNRTISWGPGEAEGSSLTPLSGYNPEPASVEGGQGSSSAPKGTRGQSPLETITEENNPQLSITAKQAQERQDKAQCSGTFFMVPEVVGIKPRDVIFIPSMKLDYLEEWVLSQVNYDFSGGGCNVTVNGYRFDLGPTQKIVSTDTYNFFLDKLKTLKTVEDWENYYWRVKN